MREVLVFLGSLVPVVALAQPADPAPDAPAAPPAEPASPSAPAPAPPGPVVAPPGFASPAYTQPAYAPPPAPTTFHRGVTFEANLGIGFLHASVGNESDNSDAALGGLDLGVGGWLNEHLALTVRIAGDTLSQSGGGRFTAAFLGPSFQYWIDKNLWVGGGAGLGILGLSDSGSSDSQAGFSLDLRAGYTFSSSTAHTINLSVELDPGWYSLRIVGDGTDPNASISASYTAVALLLGYQYL